MAAPGPGYPCLRATDDGCVLDLSVQPGAKHTGIDGLHDGALRVRLAAPPVDGKANAALIAFLAKACGVSKSAVELVSGDTCRAKRVRVSGADAARVAALCGDL